MPTPRAIAFELSLEEGALAVGKYTGLLEEEVALDIVADVVKPG